jgi:hypothetical protein
MRADGSVVNGRSGHDVPMLDDARSFGPVDVVDIIIGLPRSDRIDMDDGVFGTDHDTGNLCPCDGVKRQYSVHVLITGFTHVERSSRAAEERIKRSDRGGPTIRDVGIMLDVVRSEVFIERGRDVLCRIKQVRKIVHRALQLRLRDVRSGGRWAFELGDVAGIDTRDRYVTRSVVVRRRGSECGCGASQKRGKQLPRYARHCS